MSYFNWIKKINPRDVIIVGLLVYILLQATCSKPVQETVANEITTETSTETEVKVVEKNDKGSTIPTTKPTKQKVYIHKGNVNEVVDSFKQPVDSIGKPVGEVKMIYNVPDSIALKNGTVKLHILTDGNIYKVNYDLTTKDSIVTKTITTTITKKETVVQSGWFAVASSKIGFDLKIQELGLGAEYIHKNSWLVGLGGTYNTNPAIDLPARDRLGAAVRFGVNIGK